MSARPTERESVHVRPRHLARLSAIGALLAASVAVLAQSSGGGGFEIRRSTIDAGGGRSTGSGFVLTGTLGQPDAGLAGQGGFVVRGGFWAAGTPPVTADGIFTDGFEGPN